MKPLVLSLDNPRLRSVFPDIALTQRWEVLRRSPSPLSVRELAARCGVTDEVAQQSLDALVEAGLAVKLRASTQRREITFRSISERVILQWDEQSDAHRATLLRNRQAIRAHSRRVIDESDTAETRGMPGLQKFRGHQSFMVSHAEAATIARTLRDTWETITRIEAEARRRSARGPDDTRRSHGEPETERAELTPFHIAIEFRPLRAPDLPVCEIGTWERQSVPREVALLSTAPEAVLAPREREIAEQLAAGMSRPQVAKLLGVSLNTIASATKRIYAKLGVRSRAEFARRMKALLPT
jgi:DNA-binding CsgD family transcriptional regulator